MRMISNHLSNYCLNSPPPHFVRKQNKNLCIKKGQNGDKYKKRIIPTVTLRIHFLLYKELLYRDLSRDLGVHWQIAIWIQSDFLNSFFIWKLNFLMHFRRVCIVLISIWLTTSWFLIFHLIHRLLLIAYSQHLSLISYQYCYSIDPCSMRAPPWNIFFWSHTC